MFPSETATFMGVTLVNAGAVTTTYTAPASCTREPRYFVADLKDGKPVLQYQLSSTCNGHPFINTIMCLPSEDAFFSANKNLDVETAQIYTYYSPARACPSGWVTKGVASAASNGAVTSSGDAFSWPAQTTPYPYIPYPNYFVYNLEPQETAVFCCPSDYTVMTLGGGCFKQQPTPSDFGKSTVCQVFGTPLGMGIVSTMHGSSLSVPFVTFSSLDIDSSETVEVSQLATQHNIAPTNVALVDEVPLIILAHKPGDIKDGGSNSGNGNGSGKSAAAHEGLTFFGMVPFAFAWATVCAAILV